MSEVTTLTTSNGIAFTSTGILVTQTNLPFTEWLESGLEFRRYINSINALEGLLWGDWLNWGKAQYGEEYRRGVAIVVPPDDPRAHYADKTIWQYMYTAEHVPVDVWGLPGLSHRHYFDTVTRIKNEDGIRAHLLRVSEAEMNTKEAYAALPPGRKRSLPDTIPEDHTFELQQENYNLRQELALKRAELAQVGLIADKATELLSQVADRLPKDKVIPVLEHRHITGDLAAVALRVWELWQQSRIVEMAEMIEEMGRLLGCSARAETITVMDIY